LHNVTVNEKEIESFLPKIYDELADLSKEEIIKRFVSEEFNRFLAYYQNQPDLEEGASRGENNRTSRFFINLGEMDGLNRQSLKDLLIDFSGVQARMLFNIDVKNSFSFFETETQFKEKFLALNEDQLFFNDRKISLELSQRKNDSGRSDGKRSERYSNGKSNFDFKNNGGERGRGKFGKDKSSTRFSDKSKREGGNFSSDSRKRKEKFGY
jgi:ATP-dependent RNA helicase DeaD